MKNKTMSILHCTGLFLVLFACGPCVSVAGDAAWVDVTNNVGGEKWGAYGVHYLKAVPGADEVIAGIGECGLWSTTDAGATWKKLGGDEIRHRPTKIVFDPKNPAVYWECGIYGTSPFKTEDGGKTFKQLGTLSHAEGLSVDFSDPERKTLMLCLHEQSQSIQISKDGGMTWKKIGDKLPENSNQNSETVILDSKTFLVNTAGWKKNTTLGLYRSEDAGETFTQVSTFGPQGAALLASDGAIYWKSNGGLLKSTDKGKTWNVVSNKLQSNPIELPDKRLAGLNSNQIYVSADGGATWTQSGPPAPFKPNGLTYSDKGKAFYIYRLSTGEGGKKREAQSIARLSE